MQFSIAAVLALATAVAALPPASLTSGTGAGQKVGNADVRFPVSGDVSTKQASDKCGDNTQLSCCNSVTYAGDQTEVDEGLLAGALSHLIGTGSGSEGLGLFKECTNVDVINVLPIQQACKSNIACCQRPDSSGTGNLINLGLPCIALGSLI
ncbi:fungal hydrophobin-domain-containing protein [Aspergillus coremiiformis]|uniref:Hydrophobin n=1 Tax=Aspergillus coremiiformis TaxID=138285 RepID=A0A5N6Z7T0_9EURO|nr:fungal hydrophobin-domain-containing protein [Aspergillus coremiiformis]